MRIIGGVGPGVSRRSAFERHFDTAVTSLVLADLAAYWRSKTGATGLPRTGDVDPLQMGPRLLPHIILIDVEEQTLDQAGIRLRFRLVGTYVVETMGRDNTGKYFEECYAAERLEDMTFGVRWVMDNRAPMRSIGCADFAEKGWLELEFLLLPLADASGRVVRIMMGLDSRPTASP